MELNKLRYYLSGIILIVLALICLLSLMEKYQAHEGTRGAFVFNVIAVIVLLPLGVFMLLKGRKTN